MSVSMVSEDIDFMVQFDNVMFFKYLQKVYSCYSLNNLLKYYYLLWL